MFRSPIEVGSQLARPGFEATLHQQKFAAGYHQTIPVIEVRPETQTDNPIRGSACRPGGIGLAVIADSSVANKMNSSLEYGQGSGFVTEIEH
jgi:hypothetical protein